MLRLVLECPISKDSVLKDQNCSPEITKNHQVNIGWLRCLPPPYIAVSIPPSQGALDSCSQDCWLAMIVELDSTSLV